MSQHPHAPHSNNNSNNNNNNSNQLRHRFPLYSNKAKVTNHDSDADNPDTCDDMESHIGQQQQQQQHRKNSHSKIETNLIGKRTKQLQQENDQLKQTIQQLQKENRRLQQQQQHPTTKMGKVHSSVAVPPPPPPRLVLERFEGSSFLSKNKDDIEFGNTTTTTFSTAVRNMDTMEMWCDTPLTLTTTNGNATTHSDPKYDGTCPLEPDIAFRDALRDRAVWLVSLLILQSISGIILYKNELVLSNHPSIIYFLTMLVGAGGNAGNQASVRVIRGIAVGALSPNNHKVQLQFLFRELKMAIGLSVIVAMVGFLRTILFHSITPLSEAIAITVALYMIVFTSVCLGAILPFLLQRLRIDPAHSSTSIQVIMDILGVYLTVAVTSLLLDSPFGKWIISNFS